MNKIISLFTVVVTLMVSGCATHLQGGLLGAAVGNAITDNTRGTVIGAVVGYALSGIQEDQPQRFIQRQGLQCNPGDYLIYLNGHPTCKRNNSGQYPNQIQHAGMVCGPAQFQMSCPSIQVSGTNCRRCQ